MTSTRMIKNNEKMRRCFSVEIELSNCSDLDLQKIIKYLRDFNGMDVWLKELAGMIENK